MGNFPEQTKDPYANRKRYFKTEKGRAALKRCQSSENGKRIKRKWWRNKYGKTPLDLQQHFIDTYGDLIVALELLNQKERLVIKYLYGLDGGPPLTQKAIAALMECSRQRISQLKKKAENKLAHLKKAIEEDIDPEK